MWKTCVFYILGFLFLTFTYVDGILGALTGGLGAQQPPMVDPMLVAALIAMVAITRLYGENRDIARLFETAQLQQHQWTGQELRDEAAEVDRQVEAVYAEARAISKHLTGLLFDYLLEVGNLNERLHDKNNELLIRKTKELEDLIKARDLMEQVREITKQQRDLITRIYKYQLIDKREDRHVHNAEQQRRLSRRNKHKLFQQFKEDSEKSLRRHKKTTKLLKDVFSEQLELLHRVELLRKHAEMIAGQRALLRRMERRADLINRANRYKQLLERQERLSTRYHDNQEKRDERLRKLIKRQADREFKEMEHHRRELREDERAYRQGRLSRRIEQRNRDNLFRFIINPELRNQVVNLYEKLTGEQIKVLKRESIDNHHRRRKSALASLIRRIENRGHYHNILKQKKKLSEKQRALTRRIARRIASIQRQTLLAEGQEKVTRRTSEEILNLLRDQFEYLRQISSNIKDLFRRQRVMLRKFERRQQFKEYARELHERQVRLLKRRKKIRERRQLYEKINQLSLQQRELMRNLFDKLDDKIDKIDLRTRVFLEKKKK